MTPLNDLARDCHAGNQRFWHDLVTGAPLNRNIGELLMLVASEISEAMEGERKNLMDDHLPNRPMSEVELADAVIRIMDIGGKRGVDFDGIMSRCGDGEIPIPDNKCDALFRIIASLVFAYNNVSHRAQFDWFLALALWRIKSYAKHHGYDLDGAVAEKIAYNKTRKDHSREARLAPNGKKW